MSGAWAVFIECHMDPVMVVMHEVVLPQTPCVVLIQHNDMIEQFASQGADQALACTVLPWTRIRTGDRESDAGHETTAWWAVANGHPHRRASLLKVQTRTPCQWY